MQKLRLFLAFLLALTVLLAAENSEPTLEALKAQYAKSLEALKNDYTQTLQTIPDYYQEELKADQSHWLKYLRSRPAAAVEHDYREYEGNPEAHTHYWKVKLDILNTRSKILKGWCESSAFTDPWEGVWIDGYGGWMAIEELDSGRIRFAIEVVRGPSYHLGHIHGEATTNTTTARFETSDEYNETPVWLTFIKKTPGWK